MLLKFVFNEQPKESSFAPAKTQKYALSKEQNLARSIVFGQTPGKFNGNRKTCFQVPRKNIPTIIGPLEVLISDMLKTITGEVAFVTI